MLKQKKNKNKMATKQICPQHLFSQRKDVLTMGSSTTLTLGDQYNGKILNVDLSSSDKTITLPAVTKAFGFECWLLVKSGGAKNLTVTSTTASTLNVHLNHADTSLTGQTSHVLYGPKTGALLKLECDGVSWYLSGQCSTNLVTSTAATLGKANNKSCVFVDCTANVTLTLAAVASNPSVSFEVYVTAVGNLTFTSETAAKIQYIATCSDNIEAAANATSATITAAAIGDVVNVKSDASNWYLQILTSKAVAAVSSA